MQLPELATPAPNAALSLAWFQGVRAGSAAAAASPPPPQEQQEAQEDGSGMLYPETAAGVCAPSTSPQPAAAAAEAALVGKRHTADFAAATPQAAARVAAVAEPNAIGVTVAQSRGAAAQATAASPVLGLPPLEAVVAKRSAVTTATASPAAPDATAVQAAAAIPAADAAPEAAAVPRALEQQQQQRASPAITKVQQLGRQLQQLTVTGQPPLLPPLAAAAAALPSSPHQQEYAHSRPSSLRDHHTYSRQSSCGSLQAASLSPNVSALPSPLMAARPPPPPPYPRPAEAQHRLPPMPPPPPPPLAACQYLHRALPPEGAEEFHRMLALQVRSCGVFPPNAMGSAVAQSGCGAMPALLTTFPVHLDNLPCALTLTFPVHLALVETMSSNALLSARHDAYRKSDTLLGRHWPFCKQLCASSARCDVATKSKTPLRCGCSAG